MDFSVISLIVLVAVVAIGFIKKVNLGFLSMGVAFILGTCGGMSAKEIANGFSASMFVTLVGVTFLFDMASANGTLELFSKKVVALVGKNRADSCADVLPVCFHLRHRTRPFCRRHSDDHLCHVSGI